MGRMGKRGEERGERRGRGEERGERRGRGEERGERRGKGGEERGERWGKGGEGSAGYKKEAPFVRGRGACGCGTFRTLAP